MSKIRVLLILTVIFSASCLSASQKVNTQLFLKPQVQQLSINEKEIGALTAFDFDYKQARKAMASQQSLTLVNFPVSNQETSNVVLEQLRPVTDANTRFITGGTGMETKGKKTLARFAGKVDAEEGSEVMMTLSEGRIFCMVRRADGHSYTITPMKSDNSKCIMMSEQQYYSNVPLNFTCFTEEVEKSIDKKVKDLNPKTLTEDMLEVEIALETDSEYYNACGGDQDEAEWYTMTLFSMISRIYERELNITFYIPAIITWTDSPADPYNCQGDPFILSERVKDYWLNNYEDIECDIFHVMTSIYYGGGGWGYLDVLCRDDGYQYSTSSIQCIHNYPTFAFTYDAYIIAHEMGHNFNGQHTHSCYWGFPLDTCVVESAIEEGCLPLGTTPKPNQGSIMSYCGYTNSEYGLAYQCELKFRPENKDLMRYAAESAECVTIPPEPMVWLLSQNEHILYSPGETVTIKWNSERVDQVSLYITADDSTWTTIAEGINAGPGEYEYQLPTQPGNGYRIAVESYSDESVYDLSAETFAIGQADPNGLIARYDFASDFTNSVPGPFADAINYTGVEFDTDRFDREYNAVRFDGSKYLSIANADCRFDEFSVSLWLNAEQLGDQKRFMIGTDFAPLLNVFSVYHWAVLGWSLYREEGLKQSWISTLETNRWYHAVFVYNGNSSEIYLDGESIGSEVITGNLIKLKTALFIGSRNGNDGFIGRLDDIRIYNRAIGAEEVEQLYNYVPEDGQKIPKLQYPYDGRTNQQSPVEFVWNQLNGVSKYELQLSTEHDFNAPESIETEQNSYDYDGCQAATKYYWRVRAMAGDVWFNYSQAFEFTTMAMPQAPEIRYPVNGADSVVIDGKLSWNFADNATKYHVQLSKNQDFPMAGLLLSENVQDTVVQYSGLSYDTKYYWRVAGANSFGNSDWGTVNSFTTMPSVSVEEEFISTDFTIYPNPVNNILFLRFDASDCRKISFRITDIYGRLSYAISPANIMAEDTSINIDSSALAPGCYILEMNRDGNKVSRMFIVSR